MPADLGLLHEIQNQGAEAFLGEYDLFSKAAGGHQTYTGGSTVAGLVGVGAAPIADRPAGMNVGINAAPPILWAFFSYHGNPAQRILAARQIYRRLIEVQYDGANQGGLGLQCYVLPSQGDGAIGIRLPSAAGANHMFTTTQDGCTFQVWGDPNSPFVSHTNATATAFGNKPAIITARLQALDNAFVPVNARVVGNDPTVNVGRLDYFDSNDPHGLGVVRAHAPQHAVGLVNLLQNANDLKVREDNHWYNHENTRWQLSAHTINELNNPMTMPKALVIGERAGANQPWSFYYQETFDLHLVKSTTKKVGQIKYKTNQQNVQGRAILSFGRLWPAPMTATILPTYP